jgi:cytochrome oxidase Cu insertion factor (SCO1/SenC/PrrC family)
VYFNKTSDSADDYLVDHSIIMYLLDPAGTPRALRPTYTRLPA